MFRFLVPHQDSKQFYCTLKNIKIASVFQKLRQGYKSEKKISVYSVRQEQYVRALLYSFFYCYNYNNIIDTVIKNNLNNGL